MSDKLWITSISVLVFQSLVIFVVRSADNTTFFAESFSTFQPFSDVATTNPSFGLEEGMGGGLDSKVANKEAPFTAVEDVHFALCCLVSFSNVAEQLSTVELLLLLLLSSNYTF